MPILGKSLDHISKKMIRRAVNTLISTPLKNNTNFIIIRSYVKVGDKVPIKYLKGLSFLSMMISIQSVVCVSSHCLILRGSGTSNKRR
jgi:hypothetical protein